MARLLRAVLSALLLMIGGACGGGGGDSGGAAPAAALPAATMARADFMTATFELKNPERGFYEPAESLHLLSSGDVASAYARGYRLMYAQIDLAPYRNAALPSTYLDSLDAALAHARRGGVKMILRAVYNNPSSETEYLNAQDAPLSRVLAHIAQLKPVLQRNVDVIAYLQAGFIGAWGEWHTSSNGLTALDSRTQIRDALLDAAPPTRFVQFRYPPHLQSWAPSLPSLSAALSGAFRMGFHNDCFLASATDVGTFDENAAAQASQRQYVDALGDLGVFGGETCLAADEPGASARATCTDILMEGARYNLTYLNDAYYRPTFHDNWIRGGCMADVGRQLGYRLSLVSASHRMIGSRGEPFDLLIVLRNSGWARIYNPRAVEVVLKSAASGAVFRLDVPNADPRRWIPGVETSETLRVVLPGSLPSGAYDIMLALPDPDSRLRGDARYAVRLANADDVAKGQQWSDLIGAFALGTRLEIQ